MKERSGLLIGVVLLVLMFGAAAPLFAQSGITPDPAQLTLAATRGAVETRTLLLSAAAPITNVRVIPADLKTGDGARVILARAVRPVLSAVSLSAGELLTIPVTVDLRGVSGGAYSGNLHILYHGGVQQVPVNVTVKEPPLLPLLIRVAGVALGLGVSWYRQGGRMQDELVARLGQLRVLARADAALKTEAAPFFERLEAALTDVEAALQARKADDAKKALEAVETVWGSWQHGRANWLRQLAAYHTIQAQLEQEGAIFHIQALRRVLEDGYRAAPDKTPDEFHALLVEATGKYDTFREVRDRISVYLAMAGRQTQAKAFQERLHALDPGAAQTFPAQLSALRAEVERATNVLRLERLHEQGMAFEQRARALGGVWLERAQTLQAQFEALQPDNLAGYDRLREMLEAASAELRTVESAGAVRGGQTLEGFASSKGGSRGGDTEAAAAATVVFTPTLLPPAVLRALGLESGDSRTQAAIKSRRRLRQFTWLTYLIAVVLLAGAGFTELYVNVPTFGAKGWSDYFALLAWGFGAEATRAAVTDLVKGWGVGK